MQTRSASSAQRQRPATSTDYCLVAIAYAEEAAGDRNGKRFCKWIRLAAKRFLSDLKRAQGKRPPFYWSPEQANKACAFIELLPHVEGDWSTPTLQLIPAQIFFICQLFGFRKHDGTRRFSTALFAVARKNAKSTIAAAIMLYCLCAEPEHGPQVLSAATTGDQARIVWRIAKQMVERTPMLREGLGVEAFAHSIVRYPNGGVFRPINAKASTQDGLNPSALCFDELHAHKTHDLLNVLTSAAGARRNPLWLYTTTEGYEGTGPWQEERAFAKQLLQGVLEADHYLAIFYTLDDADDDFDESKWGKANPLMEYNPLLLAKNRTLAIEAKAMPGKASEFRIKRLNRQSAAASAWVNLDRWKRCAGPVDLDLLEGVPCWGALDLASTRDMCSWRLVWLKDKIFYTWGRYFVPAECVATRTVRGTVPYQAWVSAGLIQQTDGDVTDYAALEADVVADCARFNPTVVAYDPWNASDLVTRLVDAGLPMVKFIQGPKSYHPAMQAFERAYISGRLRHGGHPVLTWNAANLVSRTDVNMNMAPDKKRSAEKIDGVVTLIMALGMSLTPDQYGDLGSFIKAPILAA